MDRTPAQRQHEQDVSRPVTSDAAPIGESAARKPWATPLLATHESLTVMTQHFFGPAGVAFALQINCGVSGKKFGC